MTETQLEIRPPSRFDADNMDRLNRLYDRVLRHMLGSGWRTLTEIQRECGGTEASCSARLREFRKNGYVVDRKRIGKGLYAYSVREG